MRHHRLFVTSAIAAAMICLSLHSQAGTYCWTNARGDGGGTIDGFAFAPDTELVVVNAPSSGDIGVPMTFANVSGLEDVSGWTLSVNGKSKPSERLAASDTGFKIASPGMFLIVR